MSSIAGYLFLSYGPKSTTDVTKLSATARQMRMLRALAEEKHADLKIVGWDYARKIRGRDDLCNLFRLLDATQTQFQSGNGKLNVVVDDYNRLFSATVPDKREELWNDLLEYEDCFIDLRQGKPLHALSPEMSLLVKFGALPPVNKAHPAQARSRENRTKQTQKARRVSRIVRGQTAAQAARNLEIALLSFRQKHPAASVKDFLASEEGRGLHNSWGRPWSYRSALHVLRENKCLEGAKDPTDNDV